jgi:Tol biopolymer transport system component
MNDGHTLASSRPLTRTLDDTEIQAAFSPDGKTIAYIAGPNDFFRGSYSGPLIRNLNIFTMNLETLGITQLTSKKHALVDTESPAWSPDGQFLAFMAQGRTAPRTSPCGGLVNYDIYELKADGTGNVTALTNTVGTGVEVRNQWGW